MTGQAVAAPSPGDIEKQIDDSWNKLEPVIEQDNAAKAELASDQAKATQLEGQIRPLQIQVDMAFGRISDISVRYYINGRPSMLNALLTTGNPAAFADELTLLNGMSRTEQLKLRDVIALKNQYTTQKKPLDDLIAKITTEESTLAAQANTINAQISTLNNMRLAAYGTTGGTGSLRPAPCPLNYDGSRGAKAAQVACSEIGKNYVWGSAGPNTFDCSGLTMYAWGKVGVTLRHYTMWQWEDTKRVTKAQLMPGDLIFFYSDKHHVGMYVGGDWMVNAPHTGDVVRMAKMDSDPISGYGRPG
jgi:cell wall-associated NlpC family hydrolase